MGPIKQAFAFDRWQGSCELCSRSVLPAVHLLQSCLLARIDAAGAVNRLHLAGIQEVWRCLQSQPGCGSAVWPDLLVGSSIRSCTAWAL